MSDTISKIMEFVVNNDTSKRLDVFLSEQIDSISRSKIAALIRNGHVLVNHLSTKAGYRLRNKDAVRVVLPEPEPTEIQAENIPIQVVYEDEFYIAVNKAPGIVVHPGAGNFYGTLVGALLNYTVQLSHVGGGLRPGLVHRLDKDTSGVVIAAKTDEAHWKLSQLFCERNVYKEYRTLVWGVPDPQIGLIDQAIGRSQTNRKKFTVTPTGKKARTRYELLSDFYIMSFLRVILETGRTHQIRVHMNYIGHPVVGDLVYDGGIKSHLNRSEKESDIITSVMSKVHRQMLHAYRIRFIHPFTGAEIEITAPIAEDFLTVETLLNSGVRSD